MFELKQAVEKLGQEAPSSRQLFLLRVMGLIAPPPGSNILLRTRGVLLLLSLVILVLLIGFGLAKLLALPLGGTGTAGGIFFGVLIVAVALGILTIIGRRRQARAKEKAREQRAAL